jgi:hypothetical protein
MTAQNIIGGIHGENGKICDWGLRPAPFIIAYRPDVAKRMIMADKSLPFEIRRIAERDEFTVPA